MFILLAYSITNKIGSAAEIDKSGSSTLPSLHMQDVSSLITPERLDDTNYIKWSLNEKNKIRVGDSFMELRLLQRIRMQRNMKLGRIRTIWLNLGFLMLRPGKSGHYSFVHLPPRRFGTLSNKPTQTGSFKSFNPEAEDSISKSHLVTAEAFVAKIGLTNSTHKSLACTINLVVNLIFIPK